MQVILVGHDFGGASVSYVMELFPSKISKAIFIAAAMLSMVMKPGPDRTVRPEKPRTAHFCGSFSIKNRSRGQKQGPCEPRSDLTVLRTVIKPLLTVPCIPFNLQLKKKKKKHTEKQKKKNTTAGSTSCFHKHCH